MKIKHLCPRHQELSFADTFIDLMKNSETLSSLYRRYPEAPLYKYELQERLDKLDLSIVTAHGSKDAILICSRDSRPDQKIFKIEDTPKWIHNFVIAFACFTGTKLGPEAIKAGVLAYLGYKGFISRTILYKVDKTANNDIKLALNNLGMKIYMVAMYKSLNAFIEKGLSVKAFTNVISFAIRDEISRVIKMDRNTLNREYQLSIRDKDFSDIQKFVFFELSNSFSEVNEKLLEVFGEENYVSWYSIKTMNEEKAKHVMETYTSSRPEYKYYELLLKAACSKRLGDNDSHQEYHEELLSELRKLDYSIDYNYVYDLIEPLS